MSATDRNGEGRPARLRLGLLLAAAVAAAELAACSSPVPPRFHSLAPAPGTAAPSATSMPAAALAWEVLPVTIPPGVDQPQWVVRSVDGSLVVLEQERWIAPLADELRAAVAAQLTQTLGAPATQVTPLWRVRIEVLRFESAPGRGARMDVVWALVADAGSAGTALRCLAEFSQPIAAGDTYLALATGHRQGVAQLVDAIAAGLRAVGSGKPGSCAA